MEQIVGRQAERAAIDGLVGATREGMSGALVLRGDAGIGKSALVQFAGTVAPDLLVLATAGVEAESDYAFAALHRLLVPVLPHAQELAPTQHDALHIALGLAEGPPADPFMVGLATLSLLAVAAQERPVLVCLDDAQWIDHESLHTLAFVARRVHAECLALVIALRPDPRAELALDGVPVVELGGLEHEHSIELLDRSVDTTVDPRVADRVVAATGGNPLALTDLGAELTAHQLAGAEALLDPLPIGPQLEAHYLGQVHALPDATQAWLLLAAAEPSGDLGAVAAAARRLGLTMADSASAEEARIVSVRSTIAFRHPLIRSAVYGGATSEARRQVHRALADTFGQPADLDRRTWHLAAACTGADDAVADELELASIRAVGKGGFAASAELLLRAADLTGDPAGRARRLLAAADAALAGGAPLQARSLLERVDRAALDEVAGATALRLGASVAIQTGGANAFGAEPADCLAAARLLEDVEPDLARAALLHACEAAVRAEHLITGTTVDELARSSASILPGGGERPTTTLLLEAFEAHVDSYAAGTVASRRAVAALLDERTPDEEVLAHYLLGVTLCMSAWDDVAQLALLRRAHDIARRVGALRDLDTILFCWSMAATNLGDLAGADLHLIAGHQMRSALGATSEQWEMYRHPELLAWHGVDDGLRPMLRMIADVCEQSGNGAVVSIAAIGEMVLDLGQSNYADARDLARLVMSREQLGVHSRVLPFLTEAAIRSGDRELARDTLQTLTERASASGTPRALGLLAQARGLLATGEDAHEHFQTSAGLLAGTAARSDLARTHLLDGEWLRRRKRRSEARHQLRIAHELFADMGATAFAERARVELAATGEHARRRSVDTASELTPQEDQIARLAGRGETNAEIAAKLYISSRTVDYHLRKVYRKLDIGSRRELRGRFD